MANKRLAAGLIALIAVLAALAILMSTRLNGGESSGEGTAYEGSGQTAQETSDAAIDAGSEASGGTTAEQNEPIGAAEILTLTVNLPEKIRQYNIELASEELIEVDHEEKERLYFVFDKLLYEEMGDKTASCLFDYYMNGQDKQSYLGGIMSQYSSCLEKIESHTREDGIFDVNRTDETLLFRADDRVFSMMTRSSFWEDIQGSVSETSAVVSGINLNVRTGEPLAIGDVVLDTEALKELVIAALIDKYAERRYIHTWDVKKESFDSDEVRENLGLLFENKMAMGESLYHWAPAYLGMRFVFYAEAILPHDSYARSRKLFLEITIPYTAAQYIFDPYYTAVPERFIAPIEEDTEYLIDFGESIKPFSALAVEMGEKGKWGECTIRVGETEQIVFDYDSSKEYRPDEGGPDSTRFYLVRDDGRYFLWLQYELKSAIEYRKQIQCYALDEDGVRHIGMSEDTLISRGQLIDPESFTLEYYHDMLRSGDAWNIRGIREYTLENGKPKLNGSGTYQVTQSPLWETNKELHLSTVSKAGAAAAGMTIPAGTRMKMIQTNGKDEVMVETLDGIKLLLLADDDVFCDLNGVPVRDAIDAVME